MSTAAVPRLGVAWYPELWPEEGWAAELARMRAAGLDLVRVLEFAWARLEPADGVFAMDWVVRLLDAAQAAGLGVIVGTPTAAPPRWLTAAHPDCLRCDADGRRAVHGQRAHYAHHSPRYRAYAVRIATRLAETCAGHPALRGWQIDNELHGEDLGDDARRGFAAWLAARYGDIAALNRRWWLDLWSQRYGALDEIALVAGAPGGKAAERNHPSLTLASWRYQQDGWQAYVQAQAAAIRAHSDAPIASNMTGHIAGVDWFRLHRGLDHAAASLYADLRYMDRNLLRYDRLRAQCPGRPWWLMETAPGWSGAGTVWNIYLHGDGFYAATWSAILAGASLVNWWHWRAHPAGQEQMHGSFLAANGQPRANLDQLRRIADGLAAHGAWLAAHPPPPAAIAILAASDAALAQALEPGDDGMDYETRLREDVHLPLLRAHWWRDLIDPGADFRPYRVIIAPWLLCTDAATRAKLAAWVAAGGTLICGPGSAHRDEELTADTVGSCFGLEDLLGADIALRFPTGWVEDQVRIAWSDGAAPARVRGPGEALAPRPGTRVLGRWQGGYADGQAAVTEHRHGAGRVLAIGALLDAAERLRLTTGIVRELGLSPLATGDAAVQIVPRGNGAGTALVNLSAQAASIVLPRGGRDLWDGSDCGPAITLAPWAVRLIAH